MTQQTEDRVEPKTFEEALERLIIYTAMTDAQLAMNCETIIKDALARTGVDPVEPNEAQLRAGAGELCRLQDHSDDLDIARCVYVAMRAALPAPVERGGGNQGVSSSREPSPTPQARDAEAWEHTGYEGVVEQHGDWVAGATGEGLGDVWRDTMHYAVVYAQDGPVVASIYETGRRKIEPPQ